MNFSDFMEKIPKRFLIIILVFALGLFFITAVINLGFSIFTSSDLILILAIISISVLSEHFSSIQIGNFLSLSNDVKQTKRETKELREENLKLASSMILISSQFTQTLSNLQNNKQDVTVNLNPNSTGPDLVKIKDTDKERKVNDKDNTALFDRKDWLKIKSFALKKFCDEMKYPFENVEQNVGISISESSVDPIAQRTIIFDANLHLHNLNIVPEKEMDIFFEIRNQNDYDRDKYDRIYVLLSQLFFYYKMRNRKSKLILLLVRTPENSEEDLKIHENFFQAFKPAILSNDLLEIKEIDVNMEDLKKMKIISKQEG